MIRDEDLFKAVIMKDYALAEDCLKAGADPTKILADAGFASSVRVAVMNDDAKMIALFHTHGVNLYKPVHFIQGKPAGNALATAIKTGKQAVIDTLLEKGFDILHPDLNLQTRPWDFPLSVAIEHDVGSLSLRMIGTLQDAQCLHDFDILNIAGKRGRADILAATIQRASELKKPFTVDELTHAAKNTICEGGLGMLGLLLEAGADPNLFFTISNRRHHFTSNVTLMHFTIGSSLSDSDADAFIALLSKYGGNPGIKTYSDSPRNCFELAAHRERIPALSKTKDLRAEFLIAKAQPAIDKIYHGGNKPLQIPVRRRAP